MKTIWSIMIIVMFGFLTFQGLSLVMTEAVGKGNLDETSLNLVGIYDSEISGLRGNLTANTNKFETESQKDTDSDALDQYFREYSELKDKITLLKDGVFLIYNFPTMVIASLPFVEGEDLAVYSMIINLLVYVAVIVAIITALFRKEVSK